jgi:hypothetical protein
MVEKFLELAKSKIGCGYVFGSQGQTMTISLLNSLIKTFGKSHYEFTDSVGNVNANKWLGKQCFDCSGLVVWTLQQLGIVKTEQDYTAAVLYSSLCVRITKEQLVPGDLVFIKGSTGIINHVGIYAGNSKTIEAIGTRKGVVQGDSVRFNVYGRLKVFKDEIEKPVDELAEAVKFLAQKSGIDFTTWYKTAKDVKYLDKCFIKIANAFNE